MFFVTSALQYVKAFAGCANFPVPHGYPKQGFARAKSVLSEAEGAPKTPSDGHGLSSRANARDLRKISPFGRNDNALFLCGLCAFARDIPSFGCGFAALRSLWLNLS